LESVHRYLVNQGFLVTASVLRLEQSQQGGQSVTVENSPTRVNVLSHSESSQRVNSRVELGSAERKHGHIKEENSIASHKVARSEPHDSSEKKHSDVMNPEPRDIHCTRYEHTWKKTCKSCGRTREEHVAEPIARQSTVVQHTRRQTISSQADFSVNRPSVVTNRSPQSERITVSNEVPLTTNSLGCSNYEEHIWKKTCRNCGKSRDSHTKPDTNQNTQNNTDSLISNRSEYFGSLRSSFSQIPEDAGRTSPSVTQGKSLRSDWRKGKTGTSTGTSDIVIPTIHDNRVKTCNICYMEHEESTFLCASRCSKECEVCPTCFSAQLRTKIMNNQSSNITCAMNCGKLITYLDIRAALKNGLISDAEFKIYETSKRTENLEARRNSVFFESIQSTDVRRDWIWCPSPGCEEIHVPNASKPKELCKGCDQIICTEHEMVWHRGLSCAGYEEDQKRQLQKKKDQQTSEAWILSHTKSCPRCSVAIEKNGGCMHMTCGSCTYEFFWCCLRSYRDADQAQQHRRTCSY